MAHELSFVDGAAETAFALRPAWHGLGKVLDHAPSSKELIAAAHLQWSVGGRELLTSDGQKVPGYYATVREDTGAVLGVVSDRYQIVQNADAFNFLDSLLQDGVMKYESAGALKGGRVVWALARMPSQDEIAPGDVSRRYVLFSTTHDGSGSVHALPTSVRVVCANTLRIATASDCGFRHTGDVQRKLEYARQYLSQFDAKFTLFRDKARLLAQRQYSPQQAKDYIESLFPSVAQEGRAKSIRERKVAAVRGTLMNSRNQLHSIRGTWWSLLNAVTEIVDHDPRRNYASLESRENRMLSTLDGSGADFKTKAFHLALDLAV